MRGKPLHFRVCAGQVGQESNLQPAVLEPDSFCSLMSAQAHKPRSQALFFTPIVHQRSPTFAQVGVDIGVKLPAKYEGRIGQCTCVESPGSERGPPRSLLVALNSRV